MSFNLKLSDNHDIVIGRGAERLEGVPYVAQLVKNRLSTFLSEWDLDTSKGLDWRNLLGSNFDLGIIQGAVSQTIRDTDGVDKLVSIDLVRQPRRQLSITFTAESDGSLFTNTMTI